MQFELQLTLPHEAASVAVARAIARRSLEALGARPDSVDDIELALSEACTNVIDHAGGMPYIVTLLMDDHNCRIEIIDEGRGIEAAWSSRFSGDLTAAEHLARPNDRGRGIAVMRALVDHLDFEVTAGHGTTVHMQKTLRLNGEPVIAGG